MFSATVDTSGLQFMIGALQNAMLGAGGDVSTIVRDESKLLAIEIANKVGPKNRAKKAKTIPGELKRVFVPEPVRGSWPKLKEGKGDIIWLNAGPNFLTGIKREHYLPSVADVKKLYDIYVKVPGHSLGNKYGQLGTVGQQHVQEIRRIMIKRSVFNNLVRFVQNHIGRLKASWFASAKALSGGKLTAPAWIERHIEGWRTPKTITVVSGLNNPDSPEVMFGSKAIGIEKYETIVQKAVDARVHKLRYRIGLILEGYSHDVASGQAPKHHAKQESHDLN